MEKLSWLAPLENDIDRLAHKSKDATSAIVKLRGGERRNVAIFFLDIKGFTAMSEKLDSEVVQLIIDHCFKIFSADIVDFEGEIEKYMGDAIMACFGARTSHEDDAERAVRAGLRILDRLKHINKSIGKLNLKMGIRIGINYGLVTTGHVGLGRDRDFTVMGDVVNTAQRLESNAPVNSLMITQELKERLSRSFLYEDLEPVSMKGKSEPVAVCKVMGLRSQRLERWERSMLTERADFIGQETEMAVLVDLYNKARDPLNQKPCVARIEAPAGSGKSRLVHEFISQHIPPKHDNHLHGNILSSIQRPYGIFSDLIRRTLGLKTLELEEFQDKLKEFSKTANVDIQKSLTEAAPFLAHLLEIPLDEQRLEAMDPKARQLEIQFSLARFFSGTAEINRLRSDRNYPLLIVMDDLQWMDPPSLNALEFIMNYLQDNAHIVWLLITRPKGPLPQELKGELTHIQLKPFDQENTGKMIRSMIPGIDFTEEDLSLLHQKTSGNPFFVEEMINNLVKTEIVTQSENKWILSKPLSEAHLPDRLGDLVKSRIDQMDERCREILSQGSVIGQEYDTPCLKHINQVLEKDVDDLHQKNDEVMKNNLVLQKDDQTYTFKNLIIQEVIYESILMRNRSFLHQLVAQYLENHEVGKSLQQAPLMFHHYSKTEDHEKIFYYLDQALDLANKNYDLKTGLSLANKGIELLEAMEKSPENQKRYSHILSRRIYIDNLLGTRENQLKDIHWNLEYAQEQNDPELLGESLTNLAELHVHTSKLPEALKDLNKMREILDNQNNPTKERYYRLLGVILDQMDDFEGSLKAYQEALKIDDLTNQSASQCQIHINLGLLYANRNEFQEALDHYEEALLHNASGNDRRNKGMILNNIGIVRKNKGEYSDALSVYREVFDIFKTIGDRNFMAFSLGNIGITQRLLGQFQESLNSMELAKKYFDQVNNPMGSAMASQEIGVVFLEIDELDLAQKNLNDSLTMGKNSNFKPLTIDCLTFLSRLNQQAGDGQEALKKADEGLTLAQDIHDRKRQLTLLCQKADILMLLEDFDLAKELLNPILEILNEMPKVEGAEFYYYVHYRILKIDNSPEASDILKKAQKVIKSIAFMLSDQDRQRFLDKPLNKKILNS